jgi:cold shock CspA family protein/tetratricopeptide (TPR) repeat protein
VSIPELLIKKIREGRVVLFLGSGALFGATILNKDIPLGNGLRDLICDEFLGGDYKDESLTHVSALATSVASLFDVQDFIKSYFDGVVPSDFHMLLPTFRWRAIFTTNYDRLVETCYEQVDNAYQTLQPILSNNDRLDETRTDIKKLPFVKLHGCITRTRDEKLPLILTVEQYNDYLDGRDRLFRYLYDLAYEYSIVFVGHSLQDPNIRNILGELQKECPSGQRHYLLKPGIAEVEKNFWSEKKISALDLTFKDFMVGVDTELSNTDKNLSLLINNKSHPVQKWFCENTPPSNELIEMLSSSVDLVSDELTGSSFKVEDFFRGFDFEWGPIEKKIPIIRRLQTQIIQSVVEKPDADRSSPTEFFTVKGEAGSGKTILLRMVAWQAYSMNLGVVLWVKRTSIPDVDLMEELINKTKERIFLVWDDAAVNSIEMARFFHKARSRKLPISLLTAERFNEWNVKCDDLDLLVTNEYKLNYLSETEINDLVLKLELYGCLGPNLKNKSHVDRCNEFRDMYGRQLLVALHESTMGEPFEDIVFNEYQGITPESAKSIYLTVCTLNRLRVPVRAGLISRIHDISFDQFKDVLYKPLEKVVIAKGSGYEDIHYISRHPEIAEIVFRMSLDNARDRYNEYIRIINKLNISYSSDNDSFRQLMRAKALNELFPSYEDVNAIYNHAIKSLGREPYVLQQMAIYERIRPNGSLDKAIDLLVEAADKASHDPSILHSLQTIWRDKARGSSGLSERKKCRSEARSYLTQIRQKWGERSILSTSLIELSLDDLRDLLKDEFCTSAALEDCIRKIQKDISENKQKHPSDGNIYKLESQFFDLIDENEKTITSLEKSFELNDYEPYLAIKLSSIYCAKDKVEKAKTVLEKALGRRRGDHSINFEYAEVLRKEGISINTDLLYYYRRAFTPNDRNYEAQFWFARFAFNSIDGGNRKLASELFSSLRDARVSHDSRVKVRDLDQTGDNPRILKGNIVKRRDGYGFIQVDGVESEVFFPESEVDEDIWDATQEGDRVSFNLGFSYKGPVCCNITL